MVSTREGWTPVHEDIRRASYDGLVSYPPQRHADCPPPLLPSTANRDRMMAELDAENVRLGELYAKARHRGAVAWERYYDDHGWPADMREREVARVREDAAMGRVALSARGEAIR